MYLLPELAIVIKNVDSDLVHLLLKSWFCGLNSILYIINVTYSI